MKIIDKILQDINDFRDAVKEISPEGLKKFSDYIILLGGASIVSFALRTRIFGKMVVAVHVPEGNSTTLLIRRNSVPLLKSSIARVQPSEIATQNINLSLWIPPHFGEPLVDDLQVKALEEGSIIMWTNLNYEIPRSGVHIKSFPAERFKKLATQNDRDRMIKALAYDLNSFPSIFRSRIFYFTTFWKRKEEEKYEDPHLLPEEKDHLIDILVDGNDAEINSLCAQYRYNIGGFKYYAAKLIRERNVLIVEKQESL